MRRHPTKLARKREARRKRQAERASYVHARGCVVCDPAIRAEVVGMYRMTWLAEMCAAAP